MMAYDGSESACDNFGKFIYQLQPENKILIKKLERILNKLYKQNWSLLFNEVYIHIYITDRIAIITIKNTNKPSW